MGLYVITWLGEPQPALSPGERPGRPAVPSRRLSPLPARRNPIR
jgi:hypothetical protein